MLKLKSRENPKKMVMIYGLDGSGKSTYAEKYCQENKLKPVVIDIDDTNFTNLPILELDISNDIKAWKNVKNAIKEVAESEQYDTIILDGVTSYLELLVSNANGLAKYSDRTTRWNQILRALQNSGKNIIFIGQEDMKVIYNDDHQTSKAVIKVNSIVNEKYHCIRDENGKFGMTIEKFRGNVDADLEKYMEGEK